MKWPGRISLTLATVATFFGVAGTPADAQEVTGVGVHPALQPQSTESNLRKTRKIPRPGGRRESCHLRAHPMCCSSGPTTRAMASRETFRTFSATTP
jgi:hypothetical protein